MLQGRVAAPGLQPNGDGGEDGLSKAMSATAGYRVDYGSASREWANKTVRQEMRVMGSFHMGEKWRERGRERERDV